MKSYFYNEWQKDTSHSYLFTPTLLTLTECSSNTLPYVNTFSLLGLEIPLSLISQFFGFKLDFSTEGGD